MKGIDLIPAMLSYGLEYEQLYIGPSTVMKGGHMNKKEDEEEDEKM